MHAFCWVVSLNPTYAPHSFIKRRPKQISTVTNYVHSENLNLTPENMEISTTITTTSNCIRQTGSIEEREHLPGHETKKTEKNNHKL